MNKCSMGFEECKDPICVISPDPAKPLFELYKEVEQEQLQFQELWQQGHDYHIEEVAELRAERDSWHMRWESSQDALAEVMAELRQVGDLLRFTEDDDDRPAIYLAQIARLSIDLNEPVSCELREEMAKLRKALELAADMLAHMECPVSGMSFDRYGATDDLWLRLVENDECTFCETHCNEEDGRDSHPWRCWLDLLTAMVEDQEVRRDG
uniref:Uncharacterized protein n=1 Tax=viral metagenome TaxID=1070528 RepID=A0A6M3XN25_9ZZZZ